MSTYKPDLETILFDIAMEHGDEPPAPAVVEAWCERFPEHAKGIRADVRMQVREDLARNRVPLHYRYATLDKRD